MLPLSTGLPHPASGPQPRGSTPGSFIQGKKKSWLSMKGHRPGVSPLLRDLTGRVGDIPTGWGSQGRG